MHGESTQALSGASSAAGYRAAVRRLRLAVVGSSECDGGVGKGLAARRTVRPGQTVIARGPGAQSKVHGSQGTLLKRLAVAKD
jgi:hypothetical protein